MKLQEFIQRYDGRLTESDQRLVVALFANPAESAFLSATELASRAGVHATTAVRLAKKLGFDGYTDLQQRLREERVDAHDLAERVRLRLDKMSDGAIMAALIESEVRALRQIPEHIPQEQIDKAAEAIIGASRIVLYGRGHSTALVDLMGRRLRRSGLNTIQITHVGWETGERLLEFGRGDALLGFAFRWPHKGLSKLLEHAGDVGATSILISDLIGPTIRPVPDIVLAASRGSLGESQSLTVPMAICNAIILVIAQLDGGKSVESLARLAEIRQYFLE